MIMTEESNDEHAAWRRLALRFGQFDDPIPTITAAAWYSMTDPQRKLVSAGKPQSAAIRAAALSRVEKALGKLDDMRPRDVPLWLSGAARQDEKFEADLIRRGLIVAVESELEQ